MAAPSETVRVGDIPRNQLPDVLAIIDTKLQERPVNPPEGVDPQYYQDQRKELLHTIFDSRKKR